MYSRVKKSKFRKMLKSQFWVLPFFVGFASFFTGESVNTEAHIKKSESVLAHTAQAQEVSQDQQTTSAELTSAPSEAASSEAITEVAATEPTDNVNYNTAYASQAAQVANVNHNGNLATLLVQLVQKQRLKWQQQLGFLSQLGNILLHGNQMVKSLQLMVQELQVSFKQCLVGVQLQQFKIRLIQLSMLIKPKVYQLGACNLGKALIVICTPKVRHKI